MKFLLFLGWVYLVTSSEARAFNPSEIDWHGHSDEVMIEGQAFSGQMGDRKDWEGFLCNGFWTMGAGASGVVGSADLDLRDDGSLAVVATLQGIKANLNGSYRSELSACSTVKLAHRLTVERAHAWAEVSFRDRGENEVPEIIVKVSRTRLEGLKLASFIPSFLDEPINDFVNSMLRKVWSSCLGEWVNKKISKAIESKLPNPNS